MNNKVMEYFKEFVSFVWELKAPEEITIETKKQIVNALIWVCLDDWNKLDRKITNSIVAISLEFDKYYKEVINDYNKQIELILSWKATKKQYNSKQQKTDMIRLKQLAEIWESRKNEILANHNKKAV